MSKSEIIIIAEGYSKDATESSMRANCSCVLVKDGPMYTIVDTMTAWDSQIILEGLSRAGILPKDINFVVNTHGHSDHVGNNNLFLDAKHVTGNSVSQGDFYEFHDFEASPYTISGNIQVLRSPGHTSECVSVKVTNCLDMGTVLISGDLFEKEEDIKDPSHWINAGSHDKQMQRKYRHLMSLDADYIVPGHGRMFKMTAEYRDLLLDQQRTKENL